MSNKIPGGRKAKTGGNTGGPEDCDVGQKIPRFGDFAVTLVALASSAIEQTSNACHIVDMGGKEPPKKNPAAVALGKLGGKKGGKARAKKLSKKERQEIARKGGLARWPKPKGSK